MKMKWATLLLMIIKCWFATAIDDQDVGNANDYVDKVLENLRNDPEIAQHLEVLSIPDYSRNDFNIRNVKVRGLLSLYRHDDCSISREDGKLKVVANVAVKDVSITLNYGIKLMFFSIKGECLIGVDHLSVSFELSSNNGQPLLTSFRVINLGDYKVKKITGLSFVLNWLLKLIVNSAAKSAKPMIINALENEAGKALGDLIRKYKLPLH